MITFLLVFSGLIVCIVYLIGIYNEYYWKRRNVAFYKKHKVTSVLWDFVFKKKAVYLNLWEVYKEYRKEPAVGIGTFITPSLYVIDPTNVQHVLSTDFSSFNHRGLDVHKDDLLADNILFMNGNRWKLTRQHMTPLFTSTKLKSMYYIIDKSALDFVQHLNENKQLLKGDTFNTLMSFCSAAIGGAVFGISTGSIFDSPFLDMARNAFKATFSSNLSFAVLTLSGNLSNWLGLKFFTQHEKFFIGAIKQILRAREKENVKRHDFADLCVAIQKAGKMVDKETGLEMTPTDELLAAQAFFFFAAGVEPTATALFGTLYELGKDPEYLEKVHKEIDEAFEKNDKMNFDIIMGMKHLDMAFSEAMRLHPPIGFLTRQCIRDSVLPVGNIKVDKGSKIFTPIYEIHHDPKYYPEPEKFIPERFAPENKHKIADITYMPFGKGNRICVGLRYASLQSKAGLVHLLRNFTVRSIIHEGGPKYKAQAVQVRPYNVDVEFIPRNVA
ncbi:cytochrome P450 6k1-like [Zerene cesonia]|uniref:cytochrome P450 6k1-like n=1 Tax=Zerene cesonia TaxID=33412 RepID=UPI0018E50E8A|nr:cytochrome P450 6k1-like [Zerene cesonia]